MGEKISVLIVDDDADFAGAVSTVLQSRGHETAVETNSESAVDRIRERRPDAIILDVMFPESDTAGFDVARSIRRAFGDFPLHQQAFLHRVALLGHLHRRRHEGHSRPQPRQQG